MTPYLSGFVDFVGENAHHAFIAVFLLALSEAIPVVGTVVPGSTLIIAISALAAGADVNPWFLLVAATAGAIAGDGLSFWLGQRYHADILLRWPLNLYPPLIDRSQAFIHKYRQRISGAFHCGRARLRSLACRHPANVATSVLRRQRGFCAGVGAGACLSRRLVGHGSAANRR